MMSKRIGIKGGLKGVSLLLSLVALLSFVISFLTVSPVNAQGKGGKTGVVTLTLVSGWTSPDFGNYGIEKLVERLNKESKNVRINFKGGAEVIPPMEGFAYVQRGMVDLYHSGPAFYAGILPGTMAAYCFVASPASIRESGFWDEFDRVHRTKGVTALGQLWRGEPMGMFLKKPIDKADLKGLKIRSLPLFEPFLKKLGAATVTMAPGELYTALEKGIVDGFCYPYGPAFVEKSWHEVVQYAVNPVIPMQTAGILLANAKKWDSLPPQVRKDVMDMILKLEPEIYKFYRDELPNNIRKAIDKGLIKEAKLPPEEAQKFVSIAKEALWEDVVRRAPDYGPKLRELAGKAEKIEAQKK